MSVAQEEQLYIPAANGEVSGVIYEPGGESLGGVLFCDPLFEERKSAQRTMVECARALCGDGLTVLRFDYRGCGDSPASFEEYAGEDWVSDIGSAFDHLKSRTGGSCGILGLRAGGNLALKAVRGGLAPGFVVLWEPLREGKDYLAHELRRKLLREMVTTGKGSASRDSAQEALKAGQSVDLDGYELTPELHDYLNTLSLGTDLPPETVPLLLLHITHGDDPAPAMVGTRDLLEKRGNKFELIKEEPFWNRIGLVQCPELIASTRTFIADLNRKGGS